MNSIFEIKDSPDLVYYNIGLTFITISFIYLLYIQIYYKLSIKIPKVFLILYGIGGLFLVIKNIIEKNIYIAICEFIGCMISFLLLFFK
jgi:hypothetical protein